MLFYEDFRKNVLKTHEMWCLRSLLDVTRRDRIRNINFTHSRYKWGDTILPTEMVSTSFKKTDFLN